MSTAPPRSIDVLIKDPKDGRTFTQPVRMHELTGLHADPDPERFIDAYIERRASPAQPPRYIPCAIADGDTTELASRIEQARRRRGLGPTLPPGRIAALHDEIDTDRTRCEATHPDHHPALGPPGKKIAVLVATQSGPPRMRHVHAYQLSAPSTAYDESGHSICAQLRSKSRIDDPHRYVECVIAHGTSPDLHTHTTLLKALATRIREQRAAIGTIPDLIGTHPEHCVPDPLDPGLRAPDSVAITSFDSDPPLQTTVPAYRLTGVSRAQRTDPDTGKTRHCVAARAPHPTRHGETIRCVIAHSDTESLHRAEIQAASVRTRTERIRRRHAQFESERNAKVRESLAAHQPAVAHAERRHRIALAASAAALAAGTLAATALGAAVIPALAGITIASAGATLYTHRRAARARTARDTETKTVRTDFNSRWQDAAYRTPEERTYERIEDAAARISSLPVARTGCVPDPDRSVSRDFSRDAFGSRGL